MLVLVLLRRPGLIFCKLCIHTSSPFLIVFLLIFPWWEWEGSTLTECLSPGTVPILFIADTCQCANENMTMTWTLAILNVMHDNLFVTDTCQFADDMPNDAQCNS